MATSKTASATSAKTTTKKPRSTAKTSTPKTSETTTVVAETPVFDTEAVESVTDKNSEEKPEFELVLMDVSDIQPRSNVRYGWDSLAEENSSADLYRDHINDLKASIRKHGFKPSEPLEVFFIEEDGKQIPILKEGYNRHKACLEILASDPLFTFIKGQQPRQVHACVVPAPLSQSELVMSQFDSNTALGNTLLDKAYVFTVLSEDALLLDENKQKLPMMNEKGKTKRLDRIGKLYNLSRQQVQKFLDIYKLDNSNKNWIQEGLLQEARKSKEDNTVNDDEDEESTKAQKKPQKIYVSFSAVSQLLVQVKKPKEADAVLREVYKSVEKGTAEQHGGFVKPVFIMVTAQKLFPQYFTTTTEDKQQEKPEQQEIQDLTEQPSGLTQAESTTDEEFAVAEETTANENGNKPVLSGKTNGQLERVAKTPVEDKKLFSESSMRHRSMLGRCLEHNAHYFLESTNDDNGIVSVDLPVEVLDEIKEHLLALQRIETTDQVIEQNGQKNNLDQTTFNQGSEEVQLIEESPSPVLTAIEQAEQSLNNEDLDPEKEPEF